MATVAVRKERTMKKIAVLIINIALIVSFLNIQTNALEKNYKWISLPLYGGVITSMCEDNTSQYCGTSGDGLYSKIINNPWEKIESKLLPNYINCLYAVGESVYCGTNEFIYVKEGGSNWFEASEVLKNEKVKVKQIMSSGNIEQYILYAATDRGLYRSTDKAKTWEKPQKNMMFPVEVVVNDKNHPERMFLAGGSSRLFTSINFGKTWEEVFNDKSYGKIISLSVSSSTPEKIYAGTSNKGMYVSNDLGNTWNSISKGLSNLYISFLYEDENSTLFAGTFGGLYCLKKGKEVWEELGNGLRNKNLLSGYWSNINDAWYVGTNGDGIRKLSLNDDWLPDNTNIKNVHVRCLLQDENGETVVCGTWGGGIFRSFDGGKSWKNTSDGSINPYILCLHKTDEKTYLAGTYNGGIYKSINNGLSWEKMNTASLFSKYIYSIASNPTNKNELTVGTKGNIFRSVDSGANWRKLSLGDFDNPIGNVNDIEYNSENPKEIVVATSETGIYITRDGGEEWFSVGEKITNKCITSVIYHPFEKNKLFCTTFGSGAYYSIDSGNSWTEINDGLVSLIVYGITIDPKYPKEIYIASDVGVYNKKNIDEKWEPFGNNLEGNAVRVLMKSKREEAFFAGTDQKGLTKNISFPTVPVPMKPKNNQRITTLRPTLLWTETTEVTIPYTFAIRVLDENKEIVYEMKNISGDQFIIPKDVLNRYTKYSWVVKAESYLGDTEWSKEYYFTIITKIELKINEPLMTVNSKIQEIDPGRRTVPIIESGRTFMPISSLINAFGGQIQWNQDERKISIEFQSINVELQIGNPIAVVDGKEKEIENGSEKVVPFIKNSRTMLPLRFIAETLSIHIDWNQETKTITLEYPK